MKYFGPIYDTCRIGIQETITFILLFFKTYCRNFDSFDSMSYKVNETRRVFIIEKTHLSSLGQLKNVYVTMNIFFKGLI